MKYLQKHELVDGKIYEGESDDFDALSATWNSDQNCFITYLQFADKNYELKLMYPSDYSEYYGIFYPINEGSLYGQCHTK